MEKTILNIIKHNTPEEASSKIFELFAKAKSKEIYTKNDIEEAFHAGQKYTEGHIKYEKWGQMEPYPTTIYTKTFKEWFHEHSNQKKIKQRNTNIAKILLNEL